MSAILPRISKRLPLGIRQHKQKKQICPAEPSLSIRRCIEEMAVELHDACKPGEISAVIGRRLKLPECFVDRVLVGLLMEHRSKAATLETCIKNALALGDEAAREAWS